MSTEITPFDTDDWGEPDETDFLEYNPDPAYFGDRHFYRVIGWGLEPFRIKTVCHPGLPLPPTLSRQGRGCSGLPA